MRYKIIDVYKQENIEHYIAQCLKTQSPKFIVVQSPRILCKGLDIIDVNDAISSATWATGESIDMHVLKFADCLDKIFESDH